MSVNQNQRYECLMAFKIRINGIHALGHEPGIKPIKALNQRYECLNGIHRGYEARVGFTWVATQPFQSSVFG
ncbi:MAG: hypothetical protein OXU36_04035 [Candidatus Poribacteria bacterium]|nr:hypothetical protein [Candidatus Poribacteria bacterium]